jgi:D-3-phosphoglycerate dehydrogenase / 2-oxoglutarate reductase
MAHTVLYMGGAPQAHRAVTLSVEPSGFDNVWLERDDTPEEIQAKLAEADFIVTGAMTAEQIAQAANVKMIQMPGVGYEKIDVAAAQARGVPVAITPEGTIIGVSEHVVLLMLALCKHLTEAHNALKAGRWIHNDLRHTALMLEEKRVGIVGFGRIGREVAKRLRAFDVDLVYYDIFRQPPEVEQALGITYLPFEELLATADLITLHVFLGEGAKHLIGTRELGLMKSSAMLINTSRGGVVDEVALYTALKSRRIAAAGLDVFEIEPTPADNPLLQLDNILVTPHMATANRDSMIKKSQACYANFARVLRGEPPINTVLPYGAVEAGAGKTA